MNSLPDESNWIFRHVAEVYPGRIKHLENGKSADEILYDISNALTNSINECTFNIGWEYAEKSNNDSRAVFQFPIDNLIFDILFNGRSGYRAHYLVSREAGRSFNSKIINIIVSKLDTYSDLMQIRKIDKFYNDLGMVGVRKSKILESLNNVLAKVSFSTSVMDSQKGVRNLLYMPPEGEIIVDKERRWMQIWPEETWLDIKGAFLGMGGPYQNKSLEERENDLNRNGET